MSQPSAHSQPHVNTNMSFVWKFVTVSDEDTKLAICNTCKDKVNCRESTTTML